MAGEQFNGDAYELVLGGRKRGLIWQYKPEVGGDGLLLVVHNANLSSSKASDVEFKTVVWDENGKSFAAGDQKGQVYDFKVFKNAFVSAKGPGYEVTGLHYLLHTRGKEVLVGCADGSILVLDTASRSLRATLRGGHEFPVHSLSSHPHHPTFLSASTDRIALWSTTDWLQSRSLNSTAGIVSASYVSGGDRIVALLRDGLVLIWDALTLTVDFRLHVPTTGMPTAFVMSYDGLSLVVGDSLGALHLFDLTSETLVRIAQLPDSSRGVKKLQTDSSGMHTVALGEDGRLFFLRFSPVQCVILFEIYSPLQLVQSFAIDPCGRYLAACMTDATLRLYDLRPRKKAADIKGRQRLLPSHAADGSEASAPSIAESKGAAPDDGGAPPSLLTPKAAADIIDALFGETKRVDGEGPPFIRGPKKVPEVEEEKETKAKAARTKWQIGSLYHLISKSTSGRIRNYMHPAKLQALLSGCGSFPDKHRLLIWKLLLRIPENAEAFHSLTNKGIHPSFSNLEVRYPLRSESLLKRLKVVCSALAHWSDVMAELEYAPVIAFPFLVLFRGDDLAAFEATLSILLHWQHGFLATFPSPPITILSTLEQLLKVHDPSLRRHFVEINADAQSYGWLLLRSIFTEVLTRREWLQLWDNLLTAADRPQLLLFAVVAYLIHQRRILLSVHTKEEVEATLRKQNPINITRLIATTFRLEDSTPPDLLTPLRQRAALGAPGNPGVSSPLSGGDEAAAKVIMENVTVSPDPWPLPVGYYPAFDGYPKYVVDYQLRERARIAIEEEEIRRKRDYMDAISKKTEEVARAEQVWLSEKQILIEAEERRRKEAEDLHLQRMTESKRLDEMMRARRLKAMEDMEQGAARSLQLAKRLKEVEARRMKEEVERVRHRQEYELRAREEEEKLLALERRVSERIASSMLSRFEEDRMRQMRAELERKREVLELEDRRMRERWALEDAEREAKAKAEQEKREQLMRVDGAIAAQAEIDQAFLAAQIERDIKLTNLERARRLRHLQEEQAKAAQEAALVRMREAEVERKQELQQVEEVLRGTRAAQLQRRAEREAEIEKERKAAQAEAEKRMQKAEELERQAKRKELQDKILSERQKEVEKALVEEREMQQMLLAIDKEKMQERNHRLRVMLQAEERKVLEEFEGVVEEAESRLIAQERRKFEEQRKAVQEQGAQADAALLERHQRKIAELQARRQARARSAESGGGGMQHRSLKSVPSDRLLLSSSSDINEQPQALTTSQVSSTIHARSSSGYGGGSASLAISPPTSSRSSAVGKLTTTQGSSSAPTDTPSLEKALNLDEDEESEGSLGGTAEEDEGDDSVVGKAKRTLERHRQIKADAARDRAQRERSAKQREARMGQGGGLTHLGI